MIPAIAAVLGSGISTTPLSLKALADIFEAYVWSLVVTAARVEGAAIRFEDVHGKIAPSLIFRTSPGQIYSTAQPYTHAVIAFAGQPLLEAHVGIKVSGKSGVYHEIDVAVVLRSEAVTCRRGNATPRSSKLLLAAECKYYGSLLKLDLARSFLGLSADLSARERFFVPNTHSTSVEKLLASKRENWERDITPVNPNEVERLVNAFKATFRDFKAK